MLFASTDLALHGNLSPIEIRWKDSLCFLRDQGKTMLNIHFVFVDKLKRNSSNSVALTLHTEKPFPYTIQEKPQMALEVKPQTNVLIISKIPTNRQENKTD